MRNAWKVFLILPILIYACNGSSDDCSETEKQLEDCKANGKFLLEALSVVEDKLDDCLDQVDSLEEVPPVIIRDTVFVILVDTVLKMDTLHIVDTLEIRDTIIKSEVIYQRDTVCVPTVQCDTVMVQKLLIINGDTNWWIRPYIRCPLEHFQIYTDIRIQGYSTGMHTDPGGYKFGCMRVLVNGTDSLIDYGSRMCFDVPVEHLDKAYYPTRVLLPRDSIRTISYEFYNDDYGYYNGEYEDVNIYIYGILVDSVDYFSPAYIDAPVYTGWTDDSTHIKILRKGTITVNINQ